MPVWSEFVDVIYATLVCVSTALGGSMGLAIVVVSLVARVALLPLTLRLAYRALEAQAAVKKIESRPRSFSACSAPFGAAWPRAGVSCGSRTSRCRTPRWPGAARS